MANFNKQIFLEDFLSGASHTEEGGLQKRHVASRGERKVKNRIKSVT